MIGKKGDCRWDGWRGGPKYFPPGKIVIKEAFPLFYTPLKGLGGKGKPKRNQAFPSQGFHSIGRLSRGPEKFPGSLDRGKVLPIPFFRDLRPIPFPKDPPKLPKAGLWRGPFAIGFRKGHLGRNHSFGGLGALGS